MNWKGLLQNSIQTLLNYLKKLKSDNTNFFLNFFRVQCNFGWMTHSTDSSKKKYLFENFTLISWKNMKSLVHKSIYMNRKIPKRKSNKTKRKIQRKKTFSATERTHKFHWMLRQETPSRTMADLFKIIFQLNIVSSIHHFTNKFGLNRMEIVDCIKLEPKSKSDVRIEMKIGKINRQGWMCVLSSFFFYFWEIFFNHIKFSYFREVCRITGHKFE